MTCRAILHRDGQEHVPALLVRLGKLSARQCDHEYKGEQGDCPTCKAMLETTDFSDGGSFAAAMAGRDPVVTYVGAAYGEGGTEPFRIPHFAHPRNYWAGAGMKPGDCANPDRETHRLNLLALKFCYEQSYSGCKVVMEARLRAPGDPPRDYSPDLAVFGANGERLVAVEYQRSREAYEKFADRDTLRMSEGWAAVDWWFDDTQDNPSKPARTVYDQSQRHRTHLALVGRPIYRCWVDPITFVMQADHGRCGDLPPERIRQVQKHIDRAKLSDCSIAQAIADLEGEPEERLIQEFKEPLRARPSEGVRGLGILGVSPSRDLAYHLERERRVAEAVVARQARQDEEDRQERELNHKLQLAGEIRELSLSAAILGEQATTTACTSWTVASLEEERDRLAGLQPEAALAREKQAEERRRVAQEQADQAEVERLRSQLLASGDYTEEDLDGATLSQLRAVSRDLARRQERRRIAQEQAAAEATAEEARLRLAELQAERVQRRAEEEDAARLREEQRRQRQAESAARFAAFQQKQADEKAQADQRAWDLRWGVPIGTLGATFSVHQGTTDFKGTVIQWNKDRPIVEGWHKKKLLRVWVEAPSNCRYLGGPTHPNT